MKPWCIEVALTEELEDPDRAVVAQLLPGIEAGRILAIRGFVLPGTLSREQAERAAREVLSDPVTDRFRIVGADDDPSWPGHAGATRLVIRRRTGVMDPVARSVCEALAEIGIEIPIAATYRAWLLPAGAGEAHRIGKALANDVIEETLVDEMPRSLPASSPSPTITRVEIPLEGLDADALVALSGERCFSLNRVEMQKIQGYFDELGRAPTLTELETIAQTWSEHCKHKTLMGTVEFEDRAAGTSKRYDNMLRETIVSVTNDIAAPWCVSVFVDNAGVIDFDGQDCLCIKVETHNHPSAIEPFGGAGTGIGGVIRDILGTGLGARPLCNVDVFCVAPPDLAWDRVPPGCLHPARVLDGVIAGVRDYGNPMGIPTVTGAVHFDDAFIGNPLVYCGTVGILPKHKVNKAAKPGDRILVAGGRTGRDGIHGATFSSVELHEESEMVSSGAVQIGDPITEKKVTDALIEARDLGLYNATTDCGAGGLSSAVGEMGEDTGARADMARVPLKYDGLTATEIWISEAQERMVFAVPPAKVEKFRQVFARYEVEVTDIGEFTDTKRLEVRYGDLTVADLDMGFLHGGVPKVVRKAVYEPPELRAFEPGGDVDANATLLTLLAQPAIASKEWITRQYDHEVQGCSLAKPFSGVRQRGPGDGAVTVPKPGTPLGFALGTGLIPRYSWLDPAAMAEAALDEAVRNVVVKGGDPGTCAVLDNYCWGNTEKPEQLGGLVRATKALCDLARVYRTPFISGKDSLNNEYRVGDTTIAIPGCLLVTALAPVAAIDHVPDSAFRAADRSVYLLGITRRELGGSAWFQASGELGTEPPRARGEEHIATYRALHEAIVAGQVAAAHDCSEGGLAVAIAEMMIGGEVGVFVDLANVAVDAELSAAEILFSESLGRIVVEIAPEHEAEFEAWLAQRDVTCRKIGRTTESKQLVADGPEGDRVLDLSLDRIDPAWRATLANGPLACMPKAEGGDR